MSNYNDAVTAKAKELGQHCLRMTTAAGSGHPSSGLSLAHIATVLMYDVMRWEPQNPWNGLSDRLVLSEGHAVPIIYAAYADLGGVVGTDPSKASKVTVEDAMGLRDINSVFDGHPNPAIGFPFFDAATGSLGQGVSVGAGLALAAKMDGLDRRIYVLCGDGEVREGQIWEALDFIADYDLANCRVLINCNGMGQSDYVSEQQTPETLAAKIKAYNLEPIVVDGHDAQAVRDALTAEADKPVVVLARTKKGWGVSELQEVGYHGKPLTEEQAKAGIEELDPGDAASEFDLAPKAPEGTAHETPGEAGLPELDLERLTEGTKYAEAVAAGKMATRHMYGLALEVLGARTPQLVALDGDVSNSTYSNIFGKANPDRFVECRIAEQNMVSVAAGLAAAGKLPFASTFGKFFVRAYDQVEMAANSAANVKLVGSHTGVSLGADGPSQMGVVDAAFFGALASVKRPDGNPAAVVLNPCDAVSAYKLTDAMARHDGMVYLRTMRPATPIQYKESEPFDLVGQKVLLEGGDVTLVAWGFMVQVAVEAAEKLRADGIKAGVVDAYSLPLADDFVDAIGAGEGTKLVVLEDNYAGGIGSAVAEKAAEVGGVRVLSMTPERMPKSGKNADDILRFVGLGVETICRRAKAFLGKA